MGKILSWGQNQVTLTPLGSGGTASVYKSIVQNSTQLETTEGEVTDAVIEGGEIEASRRAKSSYNLTFQVRIGGGDDTSNTDNIKDYNKPITTNNEVRKWPISIITEI